MKTSYRLEGLCCANCAAKMEYALKKLPGVNYAVVNFMTTKVIVDAEDEQMARIESQLPDIIHKYEPKIIVRKA